VISIIDLEDFIGLDKETVYVVQKALGLPADEPISLARELLSSETGLTVLNHMFRDQIEVARVSAQPHCEIEFRRDYAHFTRNYPLPHILKEGM